MKIVLFRGYSGSGKTWALASIARAIVKANRGKVGSIKGIHERNFTIDSKRKDSWRHAAAGASIIAVIAPNEVDVVKRGSTHDSVLAEILSEFRKSGVDYLLVEGLHKKFENLNQVREVICARNESEAESLVSLRAGKVLFITGKFAQRSTGGEINHIPVLSLPRDCAVALDMIDGKSRNHPSPKALTKKH